jgi:hypothetical protein
MAVWGRQSTQKAKPITAAAVIEKMVLPPSRQRFNLQLRVHSRIQPGNQPRKIWKQSLAFIALETIHLSFAETRRHEHKRPPSTPVGLTARGFSFGLCPFG